MFSNNRLLLLVLCLPVVGCGDLLEVESKPADASILKKTTQDVREFDPNAEQVDSKVKVTNPITGPLEALGPMRNKVAQLGLQIHIESFHALEGRYPKDHAEFMEKVIRQNNLQLPELPYHSEYQYDVENHKLVIVKREGNK